MYNAEMRWREIQRILLCRLYETKLDNTCKCIRTNRLGLIHRSHDHKNTATIPFCQTVAGGSSQARGGKAVGPKREGPVSPSCAWEINVLLRQRKRDV